MMDETKETCLIKIERLLKPYINLTERIRNNMNADEEMTPYRFLYLCKTGDRKSLQEIGFKKYSIDILTTVFKLTLDSVKELQVDGEQVTLILELYEIHDGIFSYNPGIVEKNRDFEDYVLIGDCFKRHPTAEHRDFVDLFDQISISGVYRFPWVFICCSSGTGKTQLPFSLNIPLLYFVGCEATTSNDHNIYRNFNMPSLELDTAIKQDLQNFKTEFFKKNGQANRPNYDMDDLAKTEMIDFSYRTLGFLVELLRRSQKIIQEEKSDMSNWLEAEINCGRFIYSPLRINDAKAILNDMFENQRKPVIFLDEMVRQAKDLNVDTEPQFKFFRSLIRSVRLVLVAMGTNVQASDFIEFRKLIKSRASNNDPWCYIVYKLPPFCKVCLRYQRDCLLESLNEKTRENLGAFLEALFDLLQNERPWFVWTICSYLFDQGSVINMTALELLESLLNELFTTFVDCKRVERDIEFNKGAIEFLDPRLVGPKPLAYIHRHVAYLTIHNENTLALVHDFCFAVYCNTSSVINSHSGFRLRICLDKSGKRGKFEQDIKLLTMTSIMPQFDQEPITGLCFSGFYQSLDTMFLNNDQQRATCLEKYNSLFSPIPLENQENTPSLDGMYLEKVVSMALILASHSESLERTLTFDKFFEHFIRELQDDYNIKPVITVDKRDKELWRQFADIRMPYCSTISSQWNNELYQLLTGLGCTLGTVHETKAHDAVDVRMYEGNEQRNLRLTIECRLGRNKVGVDHLTAKLDSLAPIHVFLARQFASFRTYSHLSKTLDEHKIWLVKLERSGQIYSLKSKYKPRTVQQVFIMVDLETTAPCRSEKLRNASERVALIAENFVYSLRHQLLRLILNQNNN